MSQIVVENLRKQFRVAERNPGFVGAVKGLFHRRYRTVDALAGIDFAIDSGELVGYIGPNGAGKSTTVNISFALAEAVSSGFDEFGAAYIRNGHFDRLLLRPRSLFLQLMGHELSLRRTGRMLQGVAVLVWAARSLGLDMDAARLGLLAATIAGSVCFFLGLFILGASLCFWSTESLELINTLTYGGVQSAQYPMSIYEAWFRKFFTFVVPLACISYFPVVAILGVQDPLGTSRMFQTLSPLSGVLFLWLTMLLFERLGVRHYTSTGS